MENKQALQAHILTHMRDHNLSESELARRAGLPPATLNRMLADNPSYQGKVEAWRQLAAYAPLRLDEAEVLAAVGLGPRPNGSDEPDPWTQFERALRRLPFTERHRQHLHFQAEVLLRDSQLTASAEQ